MNETILSGICKKCDCTCVMVYTDCGVHEWSADTAKCGIPEPVWFLSARQMRIVVASAEFFKYFENNFGEIVFALEDMLERNPFLVAKILKDAEEKELI